jgi:outer membrane lipoprotein-sorting protein
MLPLFAHAVTDTTATRVLNNLAEKLRNAKGIQAVFTLNQKDKNGKTTGIQKGTASIKGVKYYVKAGDYEVICNGQRIYHYDGGPEVLISDANKESGDVFSPKNIISGSFLKGFSGTVLSASANEYVIQLMPNDKRSTIKSAVITVDKKKNTLLKVVFSDKVGNATELIIQSVNTEAAIPDTRFEFDKAKHPGVQEVQQ